MFYEALFDPRDEEYPDYTLKGQFSSIQDAVMACILDITVNESTSRKFYNDLCYYRIREYIGNVSDLDEELLLGDIWDADEFSEKMPFAWLGSKVSFVLRGKRINGKITAICPDMRQHYFVVTEFNKNGMLSKSHNRMHYLPLSMLHNIYAY